jgi:hypothetical protein
VIKKLSIAFTICVATALVSACQGTAKSSMNGSADSNASQTVATTTTRPGTDNSEITTVVDANGVKTETRVFHGNPRLSKVVVTTRDGTQSVRAYSPAGEEKDLNRSESAGVLEETGDAIVDAAGFVARKAGDVAHGTKEGAKKVGEKTADTAETVGEKTAEGAKKIGEKTAEGAKKTGKAIKKAVTP